MYGKCPTFSILFIHLVIFRDAGNENFIICDIADEVYNPNTFFHHLSNSLLLTSLSSLNGVRFILCIQLTGYCDHRGFIM